MTNQKVLKIINQYLQPSVWLLLLSLLTLTISIIAQKSKLDKNFVATENAYRANNRGVGLLEQFKHDEAVKEFREALQLDPTLKLAKINLAIALFNDKKLDEAKAAANDFIKFEPNSPQAFYILGLIARSENNSDEASTNFRKVLAIDPKDVGTNVNLGQLLSQKREYAEAIKVLQIAYESEPFNLTAIYNLATSLQRNGEREKSTELLKKFQVLRDTFAGVNIGLNYLEQGRYAEAMASNGTENELILPTNSKIIFQNVNVGLTQKGQLNNSKFFGFNRLGTGATLIDFDGDGSLDLVKLNNFGTAKPNSFSIFRNDKGKFTDVTKFSGDLAKSNKNISTAIIAGDFDNDNLPDLFVVLDGGFQLFRNLGKGKFADVTENAKLPKYSYSSMSAAFADADHDGDLDIFVVGFSSNTNPNLLLRNNGDSTFTDISAEAKINQVNNGEQIKSLAIVPTDFNNTRDIDFLILNLVGMPILLSNQRDDTFQNVAENVGLNQKSAWSCVAAGDFNKDSFTDFFLGILDDVGVFAVSDGQGKFTLKPAPKGTKNATSAQFIDYDNDGLLDLIVNTNKDLVLSRNLGTRWSEADSGVFKVKVSAKNALADSRLMLSGDIDNDSDIDLFTYAKNGELIYLQNVGGNANTSETLNLQGRVSNKSGIGAKILLRAGSLSQQLESYSASPMPAPSQVHFGLGKRKNVDSIRVLWSSGIVQSETDFTPFMVAKNSSFLKIQEVDRKPASCPYLYTWNGKEFEFITDFLGGGEMGGWAGKGSYNYPDSDEFVRIPRDKLKAKNGFYEIRVTNELEEVMYLDKVKLIAVEHEKGTEIYPNEGLGKSESSTESIISTQNATTPISAVNSNGENIVAKIKELDRKFYDDFKLLPIRGYAETHNLTLNLDNKKGYNGRTILLLTGWTDYAFSSDNVRASQSGKSLSFPSLQVKNKQGDWQTVIESIGIPVGRPQTLTVDLTNKFLSDSRQVRIVTNFRTYWDKIEVDTSEQTKDLKTFEIEPTIANLQEHGLGKETKFGEMIVPDYNQVSFDPIWKDFAGRFTGFGEVKPLLAEIDDTFVIAKAGDEFVLSFKELPAPPDGKTYTFLLFADGYSKEADINSGSPDAVYPLPFRKMTKYPYDSSETYPITDEKRRIYDETLTRFSRGGLARF